MNKKIYFVSGLGGSGKTTFCKKIAEELKIPAVNADAVYSLVMEKLSITREEVAVLATEGAWGNKDNDWGVYKTPEKLLTICYNELFSYLPPDALILEGQGLFLNGKENALVEEMFEGYEKRYILIEIDYETWLKFRALRRGVEREITSKFYDEEEFYKTQKELRKCLPKNAWVIKDPSSFECSGTGKEDYQHNELSDPKWEIYKNILGDLNDKTYFEISCNAGWFTKKASELGAKVTGLDISWQVLDIASDRVPNGKFILSKIEDYEFTKKYDVIFCASAFHYYHKREEQIKKISEHCKTFIVELPVNPKEGEDIYYQGGEDGFFCSVPSRELFEKWLKKYFKSVEKVAETVQENTSNRFVYLCKQ